MPLLIVQPDSMVPCQRFILTRLREPQTGVTVWEVCIPGTDLRAYGPSVEQCLQSLNEVINIDYESPQLHQQN